MHISCGCVLFTFHMCDKHGFTIKLELMKADPGFERLPLSSCLQSSFLLEYQKFDSDYPLDGLGSIVCLLDISGGIQFSSFRLTLSPGLLSFSLSYLSSWRCPHQSCDGHEWSVGRDRLLHLMLQKYSRNLEESSEKSPQCNSVLFPLTFHLWSFTCVQTPQHLMLENAPEVTNKREGSLFFH